VPQADKPRNFTLTLVCEASPEMAAHINRLSEKLDRLTDDVRDLKVRQTATEEALAGANRRLNRLDLRVERIEKRLDLVEA
jgi:hypothetical protein